MSKIANRKRNLWHLTVARHHLTEMTPDMIPRESTSTWTELMKHMEMLKIQLEQRDKQDEQMDPDAETEAVPDNHGDDSGGGDDLAASGVPQ